MKSRLWARLIFDENSTLFQESNIKQEFLPMAPGNRQPGRAAVLTIYRINELITAKDERARSWGTRVFSNTCGRGSKWMGRGAWTATWWRVWGQTGCFARQRDRLRLFPGK